MNNEAQCLLLDLLKLKITYNEKTFSQVAQVLHNSNEPFLLHTLELLIKLEGGNKTTQKRVTKSKTDGVLQQVVIHSSPKSKLLDDIKNRLNSKENFKNINELQKYVSQKISLTTKRNTRASLINKYLEFLQYRSDEELEEELSSLNSLSSASFLSMANEIVKARKEKRYS